MPSAPVLNPIANLSSAEGSVAQVSVMANAGGDPVSYSIAGQPQGESVNSSTGEISGTIAAGDSALNGGIYNLTATATDTLDGLSSSESFQWTIAPRISVQAIAAQTNIEGDSVNLQALATTPDNTTLAYSAANLPLGLTINPSTGAVTGTIAAGASTAGDDGVDGLYTTTISATDGTYTGSATLSWNVNPRIAIQTLASQANIEGDTVNFQVQASTPDGTTLTYSATNLPAGLTINSSNGLISGTIAPGAAAGGDAGNTYNASITASDGTYSASATLAWTVSSRINVQVVDASLMPVTAPTNTEGATLNLQVRASTPDSTTLTYSATNLPPGLSLSTSGQITGTIAQGAAIAGDDGYDGSYTSTITVSDGTYSTPVTLNWTIVSPVTLTVQDAQHNAVSLPANLEGDAVSLQGVAITPDGSAPTYSARNLPAGLSINPNSGVISGDIAPSAATGGDYGDGNYSTVIFASGGGSTTSYVLYWSISPRIAIQVVDASLNPVTDPTNAEGDTVNLQVLSSSPDSGVNFTYSASNLPSGLTLNSSTGKISGTIAVGTAGAVNNGQYTTTITATDGTYSTSTTLNWTVTSPIAGSGQDITEVQGVAFNGVVVATFTDSNVGDSASQFTATINWGDGTTTQGTVVGSNGQFQVLGAYTYALAGNYSIAVAVQQSGIQVSTIQSTSKVSLPYTVSGTVVFDANDQGAVVGEPALAGVTVELLDANENPMTSVPATTTDSNGKFAFNNVAAGEYVVELVAPDGYAMEGSGIPTWLGDFVVGRDSPLLVAAYTQAQKTNPPAQPEPKSTGGWVPIVEPKWTASPKTLVPEMANNVYVWKAATPTTQSASIATLSNAELQAIMPRGDIAPAGATATYLTSKPGLNLNAQQTSELQKNVTEAVAEQYKAIQKKQALFIKGEGAAPNYQDLLNLMGAAELGVAKTGIQGVVAHMGGSLVEWVYKEGLNEGLNIDYSKFKVGAVADFKVNKLNKNWKLAELKVGPQITYGKWTFGVTVTLGPDGKPNGLAASIDLNKK